MTKQLVPIFIVFVIFQTSCVSKKYGRHFNCTTPTQNTVSKNAHVPQTSQQIMSDIRVNRLEQIEKEDSIWNANKNVEVIATQEALTSPISGNQDPNMDSIDKEEITDTYKQEQSDRIRKNKNKRNRERVSLKTGQIVLRVLIVAAVLFAALFIAVIIWLYH